MKLSPQQKQIIIASAPKPPAGLSDAELRLFNTAIEKITYTPHENGGVAITYEKLSVDELFAIGVTGTDAWPIGTPKAVSETLKKMQPRRFLFDYPCTLPATDPDLVTAINEARENHRKTVLVTALGKKWSEEQKNFSGTAHEEDKAKHVQWRKWQAEEKINNPQFARLKSKRAQANALKIKHSITDKVGTIERRLEPLKES